MTFFPIFKSVTIERYELFPPSLTKPLVFNFNAGPTVIAGVNGSGKTTLVLMLLRALTGPFDLPASRSEEELGQIRPEVVKLPKAERVVFGARVADGAETAILTLEAKFGTSSIRISRQLADLSLVAL